MNDMNNRDKLITEFEIRRDERVIQQNRASGVYVSPTYIDGGLTKLEDLAMRLYVINMRGGMMAKLNAKAAIEEANIFFDELDEYETSTTVKE